MFKRHVIAQEVLLKITPRCLLFDVFKMSTCLLG